MVKHHDQKQLTGVLVIGFTINQECFFEWRQRNEEKNESLHRLLLLLLHHTQTITIFKLHFQMSE